MLWPKLIIVAAKNSIVKFLVQMVTFFVSFFPSILFSDIILYCVESISEKIRKINIKYIMFIYYNRASAACAGEKMMLKYD